MLVVVCVISGFTKINDQHYTFGGEPFRVSSWSHLVVYFIDIHSHFAETWARLENHADSSGSETLCLLEWEPIRARGIAVVAMRELVHIQGGQCGNQIGAKFWEARWWIFENCAKQRRCEDGLRHPVWLFCLFESS